MLLATRTSSQGGERRPPGNRGHDVSGSATLDGGFTNVNEVLPGGGDRSIRSICHLSRARSTSCIGENRAARS